MLGAGVAATAFTVVDADGAAAWQSLTVLIAVQLGLMVAAAASLSRSAERIGEAPFVAPLLIILFGTGFVWEPLRRWLLAESRPFELLIMFNLKNLMLGLGAAAGTPRYQRLSFVSGLFLLLYSAAVTTEPLVQVLAALFGATGLVWLAASHWQSLQDRVLLQSTGRSRQRGLMLAALVVLAPLAGWSAVGNDAASALEGMLPSSGGTGGSDDAARNGVGDGEALVAGAQNIRSFAPIEDAPFIADEHPALYDVLSDTYEPPCPVQHQDRAVSITAELAAAVQERMSRSEMANREFTLLRQGDGGPARHVRDVSTDALMYVSGRTPLHLRMELYDVFDGFTWYPEPASESLPPLSLEQRGDESWLCARSHVGSLDCLLGPEHHAIKVARLKTNCIPAPLYLTGVHIDLVHRLDLFQWRQDGIVQMDRKSLPDSVPIHLASAVLDQDLLLKEIDSFVGGRPQHYGLPDGASMDDVQRLAQAWAGDVPRGWPQVQAIVERLRTSYIHDHDAIVSDDRRDPVTEFLLRSRRGPDYQFATAAALLLRALGYPTRLVSGFYARPEKYDAKTRHTPVHKDDAHVWVEVHLTAGTWATVEPTPGYDVLQPPPGFIERVAAACVSAARWMLARWPQLLLGATCLLVIYRVRFVCWDGAHTLAWQLSKRYSTRSHVLATWRLLDRRLNWAGLRRPPSCAPAEWCRRLQHAGSPTADLLLSAAEWANWALFAPPTPDQVIAESTTVRTNCEEIVRVVTVRALREASADTHSVDTMRPRSTWLHWLRTTG